jgi:membrane protease subunit HflC
MMKFVGLGLGVVLLLAAMAQAVGFGLLYAVDETEFTVITQFGEVKRAETTPGLKFKSPIETIVRFDKRLLRIDVPSAGMPDKDSQFLEIDAYIRYKIKSPELFLQNLRDESTAGLRIGNLAISAIRDEVGSRDRRDIIGGEPITLADGTIIVNPRQTTENVPTREAMMQKVLSDLRERVESNEFGVDITDVRIKRADFPSATENSVFDRMRSERDVQAQRLRAEGAEQYLTITADVDRQVRIIKADAERDANILRGEGEAGAISILAEALAQDPEFFAFRRSLEAYGTFLDEGTTLVLSTNSELFRYLEGPNAQTAQTE